MVGWDWKMIQSLLVGWLTNHHHHRHHHHHRLPTTGVEALFLGQLHWCFDLFGRLGLGLTRRGVGRRCVLRSFVLTWVPARGLTDVMRWGKKCHLKKLVVEVVAAVVVVVVVVDDDDDDDDDDDVFDRMFERKWAFMFMLLCTQCKFTDAFMMFERLIDVFTMFDGWFDDVLLKHLGTVYIYIYLQ